MIMKTMRAILLTLTIVALCLSTLVPPVALPVAAQDPADAASASAGDSPEERTLREAITMLGWPDTVTRNRVYDLEPNDETIFMLWPPSSAALYLLRTKVSANNGGSYDDETIQYARILALGEDGGRFYIDKLVENGLSHSSYQGRECIVMRYGEQICNPGGLLGLLADMIRDTIYAFLSGFGIEDDGEPLCPEAGAGLIVWSCGSHTFVVRDDTGAGAEDGIAGALYMAAQNQGLCDLGDTLVILAGTDDVPGSRPLSHFQNMAQDTNAYYGQNAYGRVSLAYTFMDADGSAGSNDWYNVGPSLADYAGKENEFAIAAIEKAFEAGAPRDELNLARVIVVYAGPSQQASHDAATPAPLSTLMWPPANARWWEIEVGPDDSPSTVFTGSLILVAEDDGLGLWTHEVGHSLYSRYLMFNKYNRISDRYNYSQPWGQYGRIDNWGLMGSGNWWGDPLASDPVHMSSFSKVSGGWLEFTDGELDERYTLTAVERQKYGDSVLRIDDPTVANPEWFYIIEARDASPTDFGAPESGVVIYHVGWNGGHKHHIVNNLLPQSGVTRSTGPAGRSYERTTLRGDSTVYRSPSRKLEFTLHSESTANGYSAVVSTSVYTPTNLVGATVAPASSPVPQGQATTAPTGIDGPLPDIDLHAWDDQGRHEGLNYATGQYETQIPGAVASGDLKDAEEWIYVPEGTDVRFEVSAYKTEQFLAANPAYRETIRPHRYEIEYGRFDAEGEYTVAKARRGEVAAGDTADLLPPDDSSLNYKPARAPGYGRNWPRDPFLVGAIGAILLMGLVGWIIGLRRR
jgi:M6 family metalloprotease-like protein